MCTFLLGWAWPCLRTRPGTGSKEADMCTFLLGFSVVG